MTDPIAAAREGLATLIYKTKPFMTGRQAKEIADAILSAFPQIAPTEDVVEGARNLVGNWCRSGLTGSANFARIAGDQIAAALTAHAAREREAIEQIIERRMKDMDESMAHYGKPGGSYEMVERADHAKHAYADILTAIRARKL